MQENNHDLTYNIEIFIKIHSLCQIYIYNNITTITLPLAKKKSLTTTIRREIEAVFAGGARGSIPRLKTLALKGID